MLPIRLTLIALAALSTSAALASTIDCRNNSCFVTVTCAELNPSRLNDQLTRSLRETLKRAVQGQLAAGAGGRKAFLQSKAMDAISSSCIETQSFAVNWERYEKFCRSQGGRLNGAPVNGGKVPLADYSAASPWYRRTIACAKRTMKELPSKTTAEQLKRDVAIANQERKENSEANREALEKKLDPENPKTRRYAPDVNPRSNPLAREIMETTAVELVAPNAQIVEQPSFDNLVLANNYLMRCRETLTELKPKLSREQQDTIDIFLPQIDLARAKFSSQSTLGPALIAALSQEFQTLQQNCEATLSGLRYQVIPDSDKLASCFMREIHDVFLTRMVQVAPAEGWDAVNDASTMQTSTRYDRAGSKEPYDEKVAKITARLMALLGSQPDMQQPKPAPSGAAPAVSHLQAGNYQLTPWRFFGFALEFSGGDLRAAIQAAYNATREARLVPPLCRKFLNISGGQPASNDNCGNVYHFLGMMRARYISKFTGDAAFYLDTGTDADPNELKLNCAGYNTMDALLKKIDENGAARADGQTLFIDPRKLKDRPACDAGDALGVRPEGTTPEVRANTFGSGTDPGGGEVSGLLRIGAAVKNAVVDSVSGDNPCAVYLKARSSVMKSKLPETDRKVLPPAPQAPTLPAKPGESHRADD